MHKALALVLLYVGIAVGNNNNGLVGVVLPPPVPEYTEDLNIIEETAREMRKQITRRFYFNGKDLQYLMLVNAANQLFDWQASVCVTGVTYYDVVNNAISKTLRNPNKAADKVNAQLTLTLSKLSKIARLIHQKQDSVCEKPVSYECDVIIDQAVKGSSDHLKQQAHFLFTLVKETKMFLTEYAQEFFFVASSNKAINYLIEGIDRLKPLYQVGGEARSESFQTSGSLMH